MGCWGAGCSSAGLVWRPRSKAHSVERCRERSASQVSKSAGGCRTSSARPRDTGRLGAPRCAWRSVLRIAAAESSVIRRTAPPPLPRRRAASSASEGDRFVADQRGRRTSTTNVNPRPARNEEGPSGCNHGRPGMRLWGCPSSHALRSTAPGDSTAPQSITTAHAAPRSTAPHRIAPHHHRHDNQHHPSPLASRLPPLTSHLPPRISHLSPRTPPHSTAPTKAIAGKQLDGAGNGLFDRGVVIVAAAVCCCSLSRNRFAKRMGPRHAWNLPSTRPQALRESRAAPR